MKKHVWIICVFAVLVMGSVAYVLYSQYLHKNPKVSDFDISEYSQWVEWYPSDRNIGPVNDAYTAREKARMVWAEMWGEEAASNKKPRVISVSYDTESEVWLVKSVKKGYLDSGIYILIKSSTGDVIAVWRD